MSDRVDTYEPLVHEVSATARMGAHPNGTWVKASDYDAAVRRAEGAEAKLAAAESALRIIASYTGHDSAAWVAKEIARGALAMTIRAIGQDAKP